jgi:hypothetical protein
VIGEIRYLLSLSGGLCVGSAWARHDLGHDWAWLAVAGGLLLGWWLACVAWEPRP